MSNRQMIKRGRSKPKVNDVGVLSTMLALVGTFIGGLLRGFLMGK